LTYDKVSGLVAIYLNGTVVAQANIGTFTPQTSFTNLLLGARTFYGSPTAPSDKFAGLMDEISLYNRALSSNEIAAIYQIGSAGKCPLPPTIFTQPTNQAANVNGTATFRVFAGGTPALTYQWSFDGTNLANATNAALNLTGIQLTNAGNYSVTIANTAGFTNSATALLTVQAAPAILSQPTSQTVALGDSASFSVTASGTSPLSYHWRLNGTNIDGATNAELTLLNVQLPEGGAYSVIVTNLFGTATSSNALLIVQAPPTIISQPADLTVRVGNTVTITPVVTGSSPLSCQWYFQGAANPIIGATNLALLISNVQLSNAGVYSLTVTNAFGAATSSNATLTVIDMLDHFTWSPIPSPRFVNIPFAITLRAMDSINRVFTNFTGTVALTTANGVPVNPPSSTNFVQGAWTGTATISVAISNLVLQLNDGAGHTSLANPITVEAVPTLEMARWADSLLLFWPMDPAGFSLETSTGLLPSSWTPVTSQPVPIGNQFLEVVQLGNTNQFYRLYFTLP
jgi:hypothetical protein